MKITVNEWAEEHFWEEPPEGAVEEFWALRWPVKASVGDRIEFYNVKKEKIAETVIRRIETPGQSECAGTGKFKNMWKVFWNLDDFQKV
jgi:hypothetical protein